MPHLLIQSLVHIMGGAFDNSTKKSCYNKNKNKNDFLIEFPQEIVFFTRA